MDIALQQIDFNSFDSSWEKMRFVILNWRTADFRLSAQAAMQRISQPGPEQSRSSYQRAASKCKI
jgi:hypothetical protein